MTLEMLVYYAVGGVGFMVLLGWMDRFIDWMYLRIQKKELRATEDEDDQDLVLLFNEAMRNQFTIGIAVGGFGVALAIAVLNSPSAWKLFTALVFLFLAIYFARSSRRKCIRRDQEQLKKHIDRYYIPSSIALRKVIREATERGILGPSFGESEEDWAKRMHLNR